MFVEFIEAVVKDGKPVMPKLKFIEQNYHFTT